VLRDSESLTPSAQIAVKEKGRSVPAGNPASAVALRVKVMLPPAAIVPRLQLTAGGVETPPFEAL
jgi:hypothetical protein